MVVVTTLGARHNKLTNFFEKIPLLVATQLIVTYQLWLVYHCITDLLIMMQLNAALEKAFLVNLMFVDYQF